MDNKLLFDVDNLMNAFYDNIVNHQMNQDAHEGNVPSFSDSTLQIRKSSRISKPYFKVKDNVDRSNKKYSTFVQALIARGNKFRT